MINYILNKSMNLNNQNLYIGGAKERVPLSPVKCLSQSHQWNLHNLKEYCSVVMHSIKKLNINSFHPGQGYLQRMK